MDVAQDGGKKWASDSKRRFVCLMFLSFLDEMLDFFNQANLYYLYLSFVKKMQHFINK